MLSVIIPTLNEQQNLPLLLQDLSRQKDVDLQVIVSDGGSTDDTRAMAGGAQWLDAPRGRGAQLNAACAAAHADWLLFLHADSRLPDSKLLRRALDALAQAPSNSAGHFGLRFADAPLGSQRFYQHLEAKSRLNRPQTINGDQGLLIRAEFLQRLGGFNEELPFLEDQFISQQIFEHGHWQVLPGELHTSARRFEREGRQQRYFLMMLMMCAHEAKLHAFFQQAPALYPQQADTRQLQVGPFLQLILQLSAEQPGFWRQMAGYALDNAWQLPFALDQRLGRPLLLPWHDRLARFCPRRLLEPALAPLLRWLFSGPVLRRLKQRENT